MNADELLTSLKQLIEKDNHNLTDVHAILLEYKVSGGRQEDAQRVAAQLRGHLAPNELL